MALTPQQRLDLIKAKKANFVSQSVPTKQSYETIKPFKFGLGANYFRIIPLKQSDIDFNRDVLKFDDDTRMQIAEWKSGLFAPYKETERVKGLPYIGQKYPNVGEASAFSKEKYYLRGEEMKYAKEYGIKAKQYVEAKNAGLSQSELSEMKDYLDSIKDKEIEFGNKAKRLQVNDKTPDTYFLVLDRSDNTIKYYSLGKSQYALLEEGIDNGMLSNVKATVVEEFVQLDNIKKLSSTVRSAIKSQLTKDLRSIKTLDEILEIPIGLQPVAEKYDISADEIESILQTASECLSWSGEGSDWESRNNGYDIIVTGISGVFDGKPCVKLGGFTLDALPSPAFESEESQKVAYDSAPSIMGDVFKILTPEFVATSLEKMFDDGSTETKSTPKKPTVESKTIPTKKPLTREPEPEDEDEVDDSGIDFEEDEYTEDED